MSADRVNVGGARFDSVTTAQAVSLVIDAAKAGRGGRVVTPNVDLLRIAANNSEFSAAVATAELVLADGMPIIWAAALAGSPLPERVAGSTLGPALVAAAAQAAVRVMLVGGGKSSAPIAASRLESEHPHLEVSWYSPPFGFEKSSCELEKLEAAIATSNPGICLLGLGSPKQELLAVRLAAAFPTVWFPGVGATIDFMAGKTVRAPEFVQRLGLEWLYRLAQEPRRLARRYLRDDLPFAVKLLASATRARRTRSASPPLLPPGSQS